MMLPELRTPLNRPCRSRIVRGGKPLPRLSESAEDSADVENAERVFIHDVLVFGRRDEFLKLVEIILID